MPSSKVAIFTAMKQKDKHRFYTTVRFSQISLVKFAYIQSNRNIGVHKMLYYCHYCRTISSSSCNSVVDSRMIFIPRVTKILQ